MYGLSAGGGATAGTALGVLATGAAAGSVVPVIGTIIGFTAAGVSIGVAAAIGTDRQMCNCGHAKSYHK